MKGLIVGIFTAIFVTMLANSAVDHDREQVIRATKRLNRRD
jgi:hypothetical protein